MRAKGRKTEAVWGWIEGGLAPVQPLPQEEKWGLEGALGGIVQGQVARGTRGGRSGAEIGLDGGSVLAYVPQPREKEVAVLSLPHPPNPGGSGGALRGPPRAGGCGSGARAVR